MANLGVISFHHHEIFFIFNEGMKLTPFPSLCNHDCKHYLGIQPQEDCRLEARFLARVNIRHFVASRHPEIYRQVPTH